MRVASLSEIVRSHRPIGAMAQRRMSPGRSDIRRRIRESRSLARLLPADSCLKLTSIQWIEQWGSKEGRGTRYGAGNKPGRGSLRALLHPSRAWPPPSFLRPRVHNSSSASFGTKSQGSKGGHAFIYPRSSSIRWKPLVVRNFQRVASIMLFIFFFFLGGTARFTNLEGVGGEAERRGILLRGYWELEWKNERGERECV